MAKKLTLAEVIRRLRLVNRNIIILSREYYGAVAPIQCKCRKCGHVWTGCWHNLNSGHGCPKCGRKAQKLSIMLTLPKITRTLRIISPKVQLIGQYKGIHIPTRFHCSDCNHEWMATWGDIAKRGASARLQARKCCPFCYPSPATKLTLSDIKVQLAKLNPTIEITSTYQNGRTPLGCKCQQCGHCWHSLWGNLKRGCGCPVCSSNLKSESQIREIIERLTGSKFPKANPSEVPWLHGLHLDGFDSINKRAFECDGNQHKTLVPYFHRDCKGLLAQKRRDWRKNVQCYRHGISLVRIPQRVKNKELYIARKLRKLAWV